MPEPIIGRAAEMATLTEFAATVHRIPRALIVSGEEGIGKSTLLRYFAELMADNGALVLSGRCIDVGDLWPYHPIRHALEQFTMGGRADPDAAIPPAVSGLMDILETATAGQSSEHLLAQLHHGLCELAGDGRLLVIILDDLQWADDSTRRLVLTLLSGLTPTRLLFLAAVRTEDLDVATPISAMVRELRRGRSAEVMELATLDQPDTMALVNHLHHEPMTGDTVDLIWRRSQGNPFVVEELVRSGGADSAIPRSLRDIMLARVTAQPLLVQEIVRAVSVATRPVPHDLLAAVVKRSEPEIVTAARTAVSARLLIAQPDGYRLRHGLLQEALEADLLPVERTVLHRRFAEALGEIASSSNHNELAHHWRGAADPIRALPAVVKAAQDAERIHAVAAACEYWKIAVEFSALGGGQIAEDLVRRAAETSHLAGDHIGALTLIDRLAGPGRTYPGIGGVEPEDSRLPLPLRAIRARYLAASGRLAEARAEYERILSLPGLEPAEHTDTAARLAETLVRIGQYEAARSRALTAVGLARSQTVTNASAEVMAHAALGFSQAYLGDPEGGRAALERAVGVAIASGRAEVIGVAHLHMAELLTGPLNQLEAGVEVAIHGATTVARVGGARTHGTELLAVAVNGLFRLGQWVKAVQLCSQALTQDPTGAAAIDLLLARARVVMALGDLDDAKRDLGSAETLLADGASIRHLIPLITLRAGLAMWRQDFRAARAATCDGLEAADAGSPGAWLLAPLVWHGLHAEADALEHGVGVDAELVDRLTEILAVLTREAEPAAAPVRYSVEAFGLLCAGERSRITGGPDPISWQQAAEMFEAQQHPYPATYARFRQAEALFGERARNREAVLLLRDAHRRVCALSAAPLTAQIEDFAIRARVTLPTRPEPSRHLEDAPDELRALTPRERDVLRELARGHSNKAIGRELFISDRTVEKHVSQILTKLSLKTRVQAASLYFRLRPTDP